MNLRRHRYVKIRRIGVTEVITLTLPLHVIAGMHGKSMDSLVIRALRKHIKAVERAAAR